MIFRIIFNILTTVFAILLLLTTSIHSFCVLQEDCKVTMSELKFCIAKCFDLTLLKNETRMRCFYNESFKLAGVKKPLGKIPCPISIVYSKKKNSSYYCEKTGPILVDPRVIGATKQICGKDYLVSHSAVYYKEAYVQCNSINATLASIETLQEMECIIGALAGLHSKSATKTKPGVPPSELPFWISAIKDPITSKFFWCPSEDPLLQEVKWQYGQPNNHGGRQKCVTLTLDTSKWGNGLDDQECDHYYRFLCEFNDS